MKSLLYFIVQEETVFGLNGTRMFNILIMKLYTGFHYTISNVHPDGLLGWVNGHKIYKHNVDTADLITLRLVNYDGFD